MSEWRGGREGGREGEQSRARRAGSPCFRPCLAVWLLERALREACLVIGPGRQSRARNYVSSGAWFRHTAFFGCLAGIAVWLGLQQGRLCYRHGASPFALHTAAAFLSWASMRSLMMRDYAIRPVLRYVYIYMCAYVYVYVYV